MKPLDRLMEGNRRFVDGQLLHPNQTPARRRELAGGQNPFAAIVCCTDSRVAPEVIFDQGLGDLFVLRVAGNVINDMILGSLEYAVGHLGVELIAVIGHKRCGAVEAAIKGGDVPGHLGSLIDAIQPAVESAQDKAADSVCRENIRNSVKNICESEPILKPKADTGEIETVGGFYDLDTGAVEIL